MNSLEAKSFIDLYLNWLRENITVTNLKENIYEITTPFVDRHNDYIQIYLIKHANELILTDDGYTLNDLELSGFEFNSSKRKEILNTILNGFGIKLENGTLIAKCNESNYPICKHNLIQAILSINDMFVLSKGNVLSIFTEDVENFLIANEIRYIANINLIGKSGFNYNFNYAIPRSKRAPERYIKTVNNPTKDIVKSIIFSWNDTKKTRPDDAKLYTFLNDEDNNTSQEIIRAFLEYDVIPVKWTERNQYIEELSA